LIYLANRETERAKKENKKIYLYQRFEGVGTGN